jgi:hypothetical protein
MIGRALIAKSWKAIGFLVIAFLPALGCGDNAPPPGPQAYPVHGTVIYKGKPAVGFRVALHATGQRPGPQFDPSAATDDKGEFRLRSYRDGDGAPEGDYSVTFEWPKAVPGPDPGDAPQYIDQLAGKLNRVETSRFKVKIVPGENELKPFELN